MSAPAVLLSFPLLPFELRAKVWQYAIDNIDSRLVCLRPKVRGNRIPSILHVSRDAREQALRRYQRCTANEVDPARSFLSGEPLFYPEYPTAMVYNLFIDYEKDVLYLNHGDNLLSPFRYRSARLPMKLKMLNNQIYNLQWSKVRRLALSTRHSPNPRHQMNRRDLTCSLFLEMADVLPSLTECTFILGDTMRTNGDLDTLQTVTKESSNLQVQLFGVQPMISCTTAEYAWMEEHLDLRHIELKFKCFVKGET
ncbi:hypothetical protein BGZ60DRAFT_284443 [Tricladium varicosporioides]|nr:hypothetical protein BGZ60DRAFT_284443 [Hymenoscyphus varicosporioides]